MDNLPWVSAERARQRVVESLQIADQHTVGSFARVARILGRAFPDAVTGFSLATSEGLQFAGSQRTPASEDDDRALRSFCTHALQQPDLVIVPDTRQDKRFMDHPLVRGDNGIRSYVGIPVRAPNGHRVGVLCAVSRSADGSGLDHREALTDLRAVLENEITIRAVSKVDPLTGLPNRRGFDEALDIQWRLAQRTGQKLVLMMIDVDHFKAYNDFYGHPAGDRALQQVAIALESQAQRAGDLIARYGGEEFIALMMVNDAHGARTCAENMRAAVERLAIRHEGCERGELSLSLGAALSRSPGDLQSGAAAFTRRADQALYLAKRQGRARVVLQYLDGSPIAELLPATAPAEPALARA